MCHDYAAAKLEMYIVQYTFGTKGLNPFNSYQLQLNIISDTMLIFDKYISISAN